MSVSVMAHKIFWAYGIAVLFVVTVCSASTQAREFDIVIEVNDIEDLYDLGDSGELPEVEVELLVALWQRPMDVNRADRYLLYDLPAMTYDLIDAVIAERAKMSGFKSIEDLAKAEGMTDEIMLQIRPFIKVDLAADAGIFPTPEGTKQPKVKEAPLLRGRARTEVLTLGKLGKDLRQPQNRFPIKLPSAYFNVEAEGYKNFGAGVLASYRPLLRGVWDRSSGFLAARSASLCQTGRYACPGNRLDVDGFYLTFEQRQWSVILGTYTVGFGERLTFDLSKRETPQGWYRDMIVRAVRDDGNVTIPKLLRGAAVQFDNVDVGPGWVDATAFVSYNSRDLYQYDYRYMGDGLNGGERCPDGYNDYAGKCASSRIYALGDPTRSFRFARLQDAYNELLLGANANFNLDDRTQLGVVAYTARLDWNLPKEANPQYPDQILGINPLDPKSPGRFGAMGVHGTVGFGDFDFAAEVSSTLDLKTAASVRAIYNPSREFELRLNLRYFSRDYANPYSRAEASSLLTFRSRQRNKAGGRLRIIYKPLSHLKFTTAAEFYVRPQRMEIVDGQVQWFDDSVGFLRLSQDVRWKLTSKENISLLLIYRNNDLKRNGRGEFYASRSATTRLLALGRGEKMTARLSASTGRLRGARFTLTYQPELVDTYEYRCKAGDPGTRKARCTYGFQHSLRGNFSGAPWRGARLSGSLKVWLPRMRDIPLAQDPYPYAIAENIDPQVLARVSFGQRFSKGKFGFKVTYGLVSDLRKVGDNPDNLTSGDGKVLGSDWSQFASLQFESTF